MAHIWINHITPHTLNHYAVDDEGFDREREGEREEDGGGGGGVPVRASVCVCTRVFVWKKSSSCWLDRGGNCVQPQLHAQAQAPPHHTLEFTCKKKHLCYSGQEWLAPGNF